MPGEAQGPTWNRLHQLHGARQARFVGGCQGGSQRLASPTSGTEECLERSIRYLSCHPQGLSVVPRGSWTRRFAWTDSDWAGEVPKGSCIRRNGGTLCQEHGPVKCGALILNSAVKGVSEAIGVLNAERGLFSEDRG